MSCLCREICTVLWGKLRVFFPKFVIYFYFILMYQLCFHSLELATFIETLLSWSLILFSNCLIA